MDNKNIALALVGIAAAGIITTAVQTARIHNLKNDLVTNKTRARAWEMSYMNVLVKMDPAQVLQELETSLNNLKFIRITKDL